MPGVLLESGEGRIRWSSPDWPEPWVFRTASLASVELGGPAGAPHGAWRILTHAGDALVADLEGADDHDLLVSSPILGKRRIRREGVWMMERVDDPVLIFLADSCRDWSERERGPILGLRYRVHAMEEGWHREGWYQEFLDKDFSGEELVAEGSLPKGRIDLGVASFEEGPRAVVFEGEVELTDTRHSMLLFPASDNGIGLPFFSALSVGGSTMSQRGGLNYPWSNPLSVWRERRDPLRFTYVGGPGARRIHAGLYPGEWDYGDMFDPSRSSHSLMSGGEGIPGWRVAPDGRLATRGKSWAVWAAELPESFELHVELSSRSSPRFRLGLGRTLKDAGSSDSLRLETREGALVAAQGESEAILRILEEGDRDLGLLLRHDGEAGILQAWGYDGTLLARLEGVRIDPGASGICLVNEGDDLAVGRVRLVRTGSGIEPIGFDREQVILVGGDALPGRLRRDDATGAWSVHSGEERREMEPDRVHRIVRPPRRHTPDAADSVPTCDRRTILEGHLLEVGQEAVTLASGLSGEPLICSREGLVSLRFLSSGHRQPFPDSVPRTEASASWQVTSREGDESILWLPDPSSGFRQPFPDSILRTGASAIPGKLEIREGDDPLWWLPEGAREAQPLPARFAGRIERLHAAEAAGGHPHRILLYGGMSVPCRLISCGGEQTVFEAPLLGRRAIASRHLRAVELNRIARYRHTKGAAPGFIDDAEAAERIEAALQVTRIQRDLPPSHLLVATNGDVMRGNLLAIDADSVRIRTRLRNRLRERVIKRELVSQVVRISGREKAEEEGRFRLRLDEPGMRLEFEGLRADGGNLLLESSILGPCVIPLQAVRELGLGETDIHQDEYASWEIRAEGADPGRDAPP